LSATRPLTSNGYASGAGDSSASGAGHGATRRAPPAHKRHFLRTVRARRLQALVRRRLLVPPRRAHRIRETTPVPCPGSWWPARATRKRREARSQNHPRPSLANRARGLPPCSMWRPPNALRLSCGRLAGGRKDAAGETPCDNRGRASASLPLLTAPTSFKRGLGCRQIETGSRRDSPAARPV
jgi:hypothetical protein